MKNQTEKYYWMYIEKVAKRSSPLRVKRHLIKHAKELIESGKFKKGSKRGGDRLPLSWMVSMQNLLDTYAILHNIQSSKEIGIYKMIYRYYGDRGNYTAPPKMPRGVKIKIVPLRNTEMPHTEKYNEEIKRDYKKHLIK